MATPLTLVQINDGVWAGNVRPIEQQFSLYIPITQGEDGELHAFLRNPERNQGVSTRLHRVVRDGMDVQFLGPDGDVVLEGSVDEQNDTLSVKMPWRGGTYDLTRRERHSAPGFYPRTEATTYRYSTPLAFDDGWPVGTPNSGELDQSRLEALVQSVINTEADSLRAPYIHSLLVAH